MLRFFRYIWNNKILSNIILWVLLYAIYIHRFLEGIMGDKFTPLNVIYVMTVVIVPIYIHNLVLLPKYLLKQRFISYFVSVTVLLLLTTLAFHHEGGSFKKDLFTYLPFFLGAASVNLVKRQINNELEDKNKELHQREMELNSLKSQINPHFLFNSLNNIYALTLTQSPQAPELILQLAGLMRYQLESTRKNLVTLEEEIDFLRQYFELEKIRIGDKARIEFTVDLDGFSLWIPPMILMTYVENAFKHGVNRDKSKSFILIDIKTVKNILTMRVENGKPERKAVNTDFGGFGIKNVNRRLDLLLPKRYKVDVKDLEDKYITEITLNL